MADPCSQVWGLSLLEERQYTSWSLLPSAQSFSTKSLTVIYFCGSWGWGRMEKGNGWSLYCRDKWHKPYFIQCLSPSTPFAHLGIFPLRSLPRGDKSRQETPLSQRSLDLTSVVIFAEEQGTHHIQKMWVWRALNWFQVSSEVKGRAEVRVLIKQLLLAQP